MDADSRSFVAECFWPDVHEEDVRELDARLRACVEGSSSVRYLGSFLIRADEVVLCQFEGTREAICELALRARLPFERLLETTTATPEGRTFDA
jgi:hypothetical protein